MAGWINADLFYRPQGGRAGLHPAEGHRRDQQHDRLHRGRAAPGPSTGRSRTPGEPENGCLRRTRRSRTASSCRRSASRASRSCASSEPSPPSCRRSPPCNGEPAGSRHPRAADRETARVTELIEYVIRGHPVRLRLRARRRRPRPHVQDVGRLQPRVRRPGLRVGGGLLRPASTTTSGRSLPAFVLVGLHRRAARRAHPRPVAVPPSAHGAGDRQAGDVARSARRHPRDREAAAASTSASVGLQPADDLARRRSPSTTFGDYDARRQPDRHAHRRPVAVVVLLTALFRYTTIGLRMRAVVESPRMTELAGINADRVERVLVDALEPARRPGRRAARAAVRAARRRRTSSSCSSPRSRPPRSAGSRASRWRSLGGLLLGIVQGVLAGYLPTDSILAHGCGRRCRSSCCSSCCCSGPVCGSAARSPTRSRASTRRRRRWRPRERSAVLTNVDVRARRGRGRRRARTSPVRARRLLAARSSPRP